MADSQQTDAFGNPIQDPNADFAPIYPGARQGQPGQFQMFGDATTPTPTAPLPPDNTGTTTSDGGRDPNAGPPEKRGPSLPPGAPDTLQGPAASPPPDPSKQQNNDQSDQRYADIQKEIEAMLAGQAGDRAQVAQERANLQNTLNGVITSASRPVAASDAEIAGPTTAFNAEGQRARRMMQEQIAQQAAATGQTTGSTDAAVGRSFEDLGNATGTYEGGLMTNELSARRSQLQQALTLGASVLSSQDQARIQEELGTINQQIAAQQGRTQNQQFYDNLGFGMGSQSNTLDEILARAIAEGGGSPSA